MLITKRGKITNKNLNELKNEIMTEQEEINSADFYRMLQDLNDGDESFQDLRFVDIEETMVYAVYRYSYNVSCFTDYDLEGITAEFLKINHSITFTIIPAWIEIQVFIKILVKK